MNSTVISGMPRQNSMNTTEASLMTGILERRPSASRMPSGSEATIPVTAMTSVTSNPPQTSVSTGSRPKSKAQTIITAKIEPMMVSTARMSGAAGDWVPLAMP